MSKSKASIIGKTNKRIEYKVSSSWGIILADIDNMYYQRIQNTIASSGTTISAVNLYRDYISGLGFRDSILAKTVVNRFKQTTNTLLSLTAQDFSRFGFSAVAIVYNGLKEIVELVYVPAEFVRFMVPDEEGRIPGYVVYDDWGRQKSKMVDEKKFQKLDPFDPSPEAIDLAIEKAGGLQNWGGQLLIITDQEGIDYPLSQLDPVFVNIDTDGLIQVFKHRTTTKGFMPNGIFSKPGIFASEKEREDFLDDLQEYQGADNSNSIILVEYDTPELQPNFIPMTFPNVDRVFELTEKTVKENIIQMLKVPSILLSVKTPGELGNSKEWDNAKLYFDEITSKPRMVFTNMFSMLFNLFPLTKSILEYSIISIGDGVKNSGNSIFKALGKEAVDGIKSILDSTYPYETKVALIKEVYGLDEVRVRKIVPIDQTQTAE